MCWFKSGIGKFGRRIKSFLLGKELLRYYVGFFILFVIILSLIYLLLTPCSNGIGKDGRLVQNLKFWDALYFSIVTVSSLGYGDMHPMGISKFIASAEVLAGLVMMGFAIAKLTSGRLSYQVSRIFTFSTQEVLEKHAEKFDILQRYIMQTIKIVGETFQKTPGKTPPQDTTNAVHRFSKVASRIKSRSINIREYFVFEADHSDFFTEAPTDSLIQTATAIHQATKSIQQLLVSLPPDAVKALLKPKQREHFTQAQAELKSICDLVNTRCKKENITAIFIDMAKICDQIYEGILAQLPEEVEQPDQQLDKTK